MKDNNFIKEVLNSISRQEYLEYEKILDKISKKSGMTQGKMDLYLWYTKTGKVLK